MHPESEERLVFTYSTFEMLLRIAVSLYAMISPFADSLVFTLEAILLLFINEFYFRSKENTKYLFDSTRLY